LAVSTAQAATYAGTADDGTTVRLRTDSSNKPDRVTFGRYESDCTNDWTLPNPIKGFKAPFDEATTETVVDRGKAKGTRHVDNVDGAVDIKAKWKFKAHLTDDGQWRGNFKTAGVFSQNGDRLSKCVAGFAFTLDRH
jgi:hypothetical protein